MRRKSRIDEPTEYYGLVRALQAVDRADAALLVIDATEGVTHQDQRLAERVDAAGTAIVVVLNKWDLLDAEQRAKVQARASATGSAFLAYAPVLQISALDRPQRAPAAARRCARPRRRTTSGSRPRALNRVLQRRAGRAPAAAREAAPAAHPVRDPGRDRPADVHAVHDPQRCRRPTCATSSASIREAFDLGPTPIKLRVRRRARVDRLAGTLIGRACQLARRRSRSARSGRATGSRTRTRSRSRTASG